MLTNNKLKNLIRDFIPLKYQVPLKYYYSKVRSYLEPEMELLKYLVNSDDVVVDIGANRGIYTYALWRLGTKVEVFEPNPLCSNILESWGYNKFNINIHTVGLSNSFDSVNLNIPIDDNGIEHDASASVNSINFKQSRKTLIRLKTLDSYHFQLKHHLDYL